MRSSTGLSCSWAALEVDGSVSLASCGFPSDISYEGTQEPGEGVARALLTDALGWRRPHILDIEHTFA